MTRRNRSRLPPKLPDPPSAPARRVPHAPTLTDRLKRDHVAGRSARIGREEMLAILRRIANGTPRVLLGAPPFEALTSEQALAAVTALYGWDGQGPSARISATSTVEGFDAACTRIVEVARDGRRIAFATACPASLLPLHRSLAESAAALGAEVVTATESAQFGTGGRRLRWLDRVAVVTDGEAILADDDAAAADELLFTVARPDLVVADRCFAGVALGAGIEVVAFADLDAAVLAVAAHRGRAVRVVPLDERRPPVAYEPLLARFDELLHGCLSEAAIVTEGTLSAPRDAGGVGPFPGTHTAP
jgi:hypothetical protein